MSGDVFNLMEDLKLTEEHFNEHIEFLIPDFLPKKLITSYYAPGGQGKSWLAQGVTKNVLDARVAEQVFYFDFDNPVGILKERNIFDLLIRQYPSLKYIQRSTLKSSPYELMLKLEEHAHGRTYQDCIFIIDSLRNIVDTKHDYRVMRVMDILMNLREAGSTVFLLHHANKDGKNYEGSNNIYNSVDCMYRLEKRPGATDEINFLLEVQKERAGIKDKAFCVKTEELHLKEMDLTIASMSESELEFVEKVKKALSLHKELNKTELLEATGHKKDDKTARDTLDKFQGKFWHCSKGVGNRYIYKL